MLETIVSIKVLQELFNYYMWVLVYVDGILQWMHSDCVNHDLRFNVVKLVTNNEVWREVMFNIIACILLVFP